MRSACFECAYKHLADAAIWNIEYFLGYPIFKLYVVGSLNHASHEVYDYHKELAFVLREHRINWSRDPDNYRVPYESLGQYIDICMKLNNGEPLPEIPEECLKGLTIADGKPVFSMDTRM